MSKAIITVGLAGAGKTWVSFSLYDWFRNAKQDVAIFNLDPGATNLPYNPDFDIREYIDLWSLMEKYRLGPNGALILSMDLMVNHIENLNKKLREMGNSLVVIDTPGQMEIFLYRASGKIILDSMDVEESVLLYVIDAAFAKDTKNFISSLLLGGSLKIRFNKPMISVLNKIDLLSEEEKKNLMIFFRRPTVLKSHLDKHYPTFESDFMYKTYLLMRKYDVFTHFIPVSAIYLTNFDSLIRGITRVLFSGEEFYS